MKPTIANRPPMALTCQRAKTLVADLNADVDDDWTYSVNDRETYATIYVHDADGNFLGEM